MSGNDSTPVTYSLGHDILGYFNKVILCNQTNPLPKRKPPDGFNDILYEGPIISPKDRVHTNATSWICKSVPTSWFNWYKPNGTISTYQLAFPILESPITIKPIMSGNQGLEQSFTDVFVNDVKISPFEIPCYHIVWEEIYQMSKSNQIERAKIKDTVLKPGNHMTFLVLQWLKVFVLIQKKRSKASSIQNIKGISKMVKSSGQDEQQASPIFEPENEETIWSCQIDPFKNSLPLLNPQNIMRQVDTGQGSAFYTSALLGGCYSMPCMSSPLKSLCLGGLSQIICPSSTIQFDLISKVLASAMQFSTVYGPDIGPVIQGDYSMERHKIKLWFKKGFEHLLKNYRHCLFNENDGSFKSIEEIQSMLVSSTESKFNVKRLITAFSILQTEYHRRLTNSIEVFSYNTFFGTNTWGNTDNEDLFKDFFLYDYMKKSPLNYPNFEFSWYENTDHLPFNADHEKLILGESIYLRSTTEGLTHNNECLSNNKTKEASPWLNFLSPNLRFVLKNTKISNFGESKATTTHGLQKISRQIPESDSNVINTLLGLSCWLHQRYKSNPKLFTTQSPELLSDFRFKFADTIFQSQVNDTTSLLGLILNISDEVLQDDSNNQTGHNTGTEYNLTNPSPLMKTLLLQQILSLYNPIRDNLKLFLEKNLLVTQWDVGLLTPESIHITNCDDLILANFGLTEDETKINRILSETNSLKGSTYSQIDSTILPVNAILHCQLLYVLLFLVE